GRRVEEKGSDPRPPDSFCKRLRESIRKFLQQASLLGKALQDSQKYGWKLKENAPHVWSDLAAAVQQTVETRSQELKRELKNCDRSEREEEASESRDHRHRYRRQTSGLEFADFQFGLGLPPDLLPGFDQKMAEKIENHMIVSGVETLHKCTLAKVLLSVGRKASTSDLGLECVGVQCSPECTDVDHIYAVGSVQHGRPSTTGLAVHAGTLLARRLFREDTALERVLGVHILGPNAGDILQGFVAAMKCGLTKQQLDATVGLQPGSA
ncbi:hypothetical protein F7725_022015, partial [Dissostichus mawsoni]